MRTWNLQGSGQAFFFFFGRRATLILYYISHLQRARHGICWPFAIAFQLENSRRKFAAVIVTRYRPVALSKVPDVECHRSLIIVVIVVNIYWGCKIESSQACWPCLPSRTSSQASLFVSDTVLFTCGTDSWLGSDRAEYDNRTVE